MVFEEGEDAERVMEVLPKGFSRFGLSLHPTKTKLVRFNRPSWKGKGTEPGVFDFLGFTHYWGRSRKGNWVVMRKTAKSRLCRALTSIGEWCRKNRHRKVRDQCQELGRKMNGHFAYYGITANSRSLSRYARQVQRLWRYWLNRRDRKNSMPWNRFSRLLQRYRLPPRESSIPKCSESMTLRNRMREFRSSGSTRKMPCFKIVNRTRSQFRSRARRYSHSNGVDKKIRVRLRVRKTRIRFVTRFRKADG